jgi:hypothetical protein
MRRASRCRRPGRIAIAGFFPPRCLDGSSRIAGAQPRLAPPNGVGFADLRSGDPAGQAAKCASSRFREASKCPF